VKAGTQADAASHAASSPRIDPPGRRAAIRSATMVAESRKVSMPVIARPPEPPAVNRQVPSFDPRSPGAMGDRPAARRQVIERKGGTLRVLNLNLDTGTPTGRLTLTMLGAIAQFEREMMLERQRQGILKAKAAGRHGRSSAPRLNVCAGDTPAAPEDAPQKSRPVAYVGQSSRIACATRCSRPSISLDTRSQTTRSRSRSISWRLAYGSGGRITFLMPRGEKENHQGALTIFLAVVSTLLHA
jgi:Resolvase, N terminal domain